MEYLVDPDTIMGLSGQPQGISDSNPSGEPGVEEENQHLEIDAGVLLRKDQLKWLFSLVHWLPEFKADLLHFCVTCGRYLVLGDDTRSHGQQTAQAKHHIIPVMQAQYKEHGGEQTLSYYASAQAFREIQVPLGDVMSHLLPQPRNAGLDENRIRCLYLHPRDSIDAMWHGDIFSGRCAFRECERIFNNKQSHLRLYGITPQFCSIGCKVGSWLCANK